MADSEIRRKLGLDKPEANDDLGHQDPDRRRTWIAVAIVAGLVVLVAGIVWSSGILGGRKEVRVPKVVGLSSGEAKKKLRDAGLNLERIDRTYSVAYTEGVVLAQTPSAGSTVPRRSEVTLEVAQGVKRGSVPDVSQLDVEQAIQAAEAAGYTVVIKEKAVEDVPAGSVLEQDPPEGQAKPGSTITLVVAVGAVPNVRTPNVGGQQQPAAVSILHDAGLKQRSYWVTSSTSRIIIGQYPPAGMLVAPGTVVELQVAAGLDDPTLPRTGIIGVPSIPPPVAAPDGQ